MTLNEWSEAYGITPSPRTESGTVSVVVDHLDPARRELWQLSDYRVSTVAGDLIWLWPRESNAK